MLGDYKAPEGAPTAVLQMSTPQASGTLSSTVSGSSFCGKAWYLDRITVEKDGHEGALMKIEAERQMDLMLIYSPAYGGPFCRFYFSFLPKKDAKYDVELDSVGKYCYVRLFREDKRSDPPARVAESSFLHSFPNCLGK
jgi:hypothetical protein